MTYLGDDITIGVVTDAGRTDGEFPSNQHSAPFVNPCLDVNDSTDSTLSSIIPATKAGHKETSPLSPGPAAASAPTD